MLNTVKHLLELGFDPSLQNDVGLIPCQMTNELKVIELMLQYGASTADVYETHGRALKQPLQSPINIFIAGYPKVEKSTLTEALKKESKSRLARAFSI